MPFLYLIPNLLSDSPWQQVLPAYNIEIIGNLKYFVVEDVRTARRFLKKLIPEINIDELVFAPLNKHTSDADKISYINELEHFGSAGIISEAGCPGIADPGAEIVALAHKKGIKVVPLIGPSSILLALISSGMNGQNFAFSGYLPIKPAERIKRIQQLEKLAVSQNQTQIFMETPYRANALLNDLLKTCRPNTKLCIAADITSENEMIVTQTIAQWKNRTPDLEKRLVIFVLGN